MQTLVLWMLFILGGIALLGILLRTQREDFSLTNLRAIALIVIGTFVTLLAIAVPESLNSAFGILGVIVGYLFGKSDKAKSAAASITGSNISASNIAGRDINQTIDELKTGVANIENIINMMADEDSLVSKRIFVKGRWTWMANTPSLEENLRSLAFGCDGDGGEWKQQRLDVILNSPEFVDDLVMLTRKLTANGWEIESLEADDFTDCGVFFVIQLKKLFSQTAIPHGYEQLADAACNPHLPTIK